MTYDAFQALQRLGTGAACEYRFPAREEFRPGTVVHNGGALFWHVRDDETGQVHTHLYAEYVRAPGRPWTGA